MEITTISRNYLCLDLTYDYSTHNNKNNGNSLIGLEVFNCYFEILFGGNLCISTFFFSSCIFYYEFRRLSGRLFALAIRENKSRQDFETLAEKKKRSVSRGPRRKELVFEAPFSPFYRFTRGYSDKQISMSEIICLERPFG